MTSAERELYDELRDLYRRWKDDYKYTANRFISKLERDGAVKTAADLVQREDESQGFKELRARGLLHLSVEALVLRAEFRPLFPSEVAEAARQKLLKAGVPLTQEVPELP